MSEKKVELGKRFGRLIVARKTDERKNGYVVWECICDCGGTCKATAGNLTSGRKKSCGCMTNALDVEGKRFGKLLVLRRTEERKGGGVLWECVCDCGKKCKVLAGRLTSGGVTSCGCLIPESVNVMLTTRKEVEMKEGTILCKLNSKTPKNNRSGVTGVSWNKRSGKWRASINFKGKSIYLGQYVRMEDAIKARKEAEEEYFKSILEKYGRDTEGLGLDGD
ncbi:hypothetical protein FT641_18670 [Bacillus paranthracis]|uniref:AP2 domain-containing protein n=1 Tax=Bacillus paranthracis TaxID=2026186 RepID=UPI001879485C|nr:AP2 domain-containing protein [Bacillus paranthracis]MBE7114411.1 hypothetical protein [Bacillus paranthracis]MBE7154715.1 hypothetical protein [Bacillus paranthracis]